MTEPTRPPRPVSRIRHGWRCTRTGDLIETVKQDVRGHSHVVEQCTECGDDDVPERIRAEHEPT
jgi:hypothetical protein